jgi:hypothetical protein
MNYYTDNCNFLPLIPYCGVRCTFSHLLFNPISPQGIGLRHNKPVATFHMSCLATRAWFVTSAAHFRLPIRPLAFLPWKAYALAYLVLLMAHLS